MIKTIPERKEAFCDKCKIQMPDGVDFTIDGKVQVVALDRGVAVAGHSISVQLCSTCANQFHDFMDGKDSK